MTGLDHVRMKAAEVGFDEAVCGNCGLYEPDEGDMGTCRRRREIQFRLGICLQWTTSNIAAARPKIVVEPDGTKRLFPGAVMPPDDDDATGQVIGLKCAEPSCQGTLVLRRSHRLSTWFYSCERYPDCEGTMPANEDGSPRGRPRTKELQRHRNDAHKAFDCLWKDGHCDRGAAYSWLRAATGLSHDQAHMMQMDVEQCQAVMRLVVESGPGTEFWEQWKIQRAERQKQKKAKRRRRKRAPKKDQDPEPNA